MGKHHHHLGTTVVHHDDERHDHPSDSIDMYVIYHHPCVDDDCPYRALDD